MAHVRMNEIDYAISELRVYILDNYEELNECTGHAEEMLKLIQKLGRSVAERGQEIDDVIKEVMEEQREIYTRTR